MCPAENDKDNILMSSDYSPHKCGSGVAYRINNKKMVYSITKRLRERYNIKPRRMQELLHSKIKDVLRYEYVVSYDIKTPTTYLYLTTYNGCTLCIYIPEEYMAGSGARVGSGAGPSLLTTLQKFDTELFTDTLFSGNLSAATYLINDIHVLRGNTVSSKLDLAGRIKLINTVLDKNHQPDPILDVYKIYLKDYVVYASIDSLSTNYLSTLPYKSDVTGLIFSSLGGMEEHLMIDISDPLSGAVRRAREAKSNSASRCLERISAINLEKPVCFKVVATSKPDIYHLYLCKDHKAVYYDIASVPDRETSILLKKLFKGLKGLKGLKGFKGPNGPNGPGSKGILMTCMYDHFKRWKPCTVSTHSVADDICSLV